MTVENMVLIYAVTKNKTKIYPSYIVAESFGINPIVIDDNEVDRLLSVNSCNLNDSPQENKRRAEDIGNAILKYLKNKKIVIEKNTIGIIIDIPIMLSSNLTSFLKDHGLIPIYTYEVNYGAIGKDTTYIVV